MSENRLELLIEESIRMEQNAAALYLLFHNACPEDSDFWRQLHLEEKSHAALIRAAKESFVKRGKFPYDLVVDSIEELQNENERYDQLIERLQTVLPSRREALEMALGIEQASAETRYTEFMEKEPSTTVETVFQQLNQDDKDHEQRILDQLARLPMDA